MFKRITKREAKRRFGDGETIIFCPCNFQPGGMWHVECHVRLSEDLFSSALRYGAQKHPDLWKGTVLETAWALLYNNWAFYNTGDEMGNHADYYIEVKNEQTRHSPQPVQAGT